MKRLIGHEWRQSFTVRCAMRCALMLVGVSTLLFPPRAFSQGATARINGTVSDSTGAVIPGAKLVLTNVATGATRSLVTNQTGNYVIPDIIPGNYTLEVSATGFATQKESAFTLAVNQTASHNFTLVVGAQVQEVTVTAAAAQIEGSTAELGTAIAPTEVNDLPLNGRNFTQLLALTPGVSPISTAQNAGGGGDWAGRQVGTFSFPAVNGQTNRSNLFYLDGLNNQNSFIQTFGTTPIMDAMEEFKVQSHNDVAAYGGALGGIVNVVTKSGTSEYHGDAWEFLRNSDLDARNTFFAKRTPFIQNQFGGVFGGPLRPGRFRSGSPKTFFFAGYEGFRSVRAAQGLLRIPTAAELSGDLSDIPTQVFNPFTTRPDPNNPGQFIRDPFPNNQVPTQLIDQNLVKYAKAFLPQPVVTGVAGKNSIDTTPNRTRQDTATLRFDHTFTDRTSGWIRYTGFTQPDSLSAGILGATNKIFYHGFQAGGALTHTFSGGAKVLTVQFGRNSVQNNTGSRVNVIPADFWTQVGFSPNFSGNFLGGSAFNPGIGVPGFTLTPGNQLFNPHLADIWQWKGDFTLVHGKHTFQMGADFNSNDNFLPIANDNVGFGSFQTSNPERPQGTGSALASFLLGVPDNAGRRNVPESSHGGWVDGFYFQDQWKVNSKLMVNLGIRYDLQFRPVYGTLAEKNQFVGALDLDRATYIVARVPPKCDPANRVGAPCIPTPDGNLPANVIPTPFSNHAVYHNNYDNLGPRAGFAYRLRPSTVIRASAGKFFDEWAATVQLSQNYEGTWPDIGQLLAQNLNNPVPGSPLPTRKAEDPFGQGAGFVPIPAPTPFKQVQWFIDPRWQNPYSLQWNFGVQQQLGTSTVLEADYVGSHSSRLNQGGFRNVAVTPGPGDPALRRPIPFISPTFYDKSTGKANYNAFQFKLRRSSSYGLSYIVSYTWSKTIDVACDGFFGAEGCSVQNPFNYNADRSVAGFDIPHMLVTSWVYELPFGPGKRFSSGGRILNGLAGGWSVNGIWTVRSGQPFNVGAPAAIANTGNVTERANIIGPAFPSNRTRNNFLNTASFQAPAPFTFGNLGRNSLRSLHLQNWDLSLFKRVQLPFKESNKLEFRVEFFNAFNQTVLGLPDGFITDPSFGQVFGTANTEREIQFALKLYW